MLLGACAGAPQRESAPAPAPVTAEQRLPEAAPPAPVAAPAPRPGGYYKDDGPGDIPPADLAGIPAAPPRAEPLHRFANEPYSVMGQDYTPSKQLTKFRQRGLASWYGRMFHGKKTSIGEIYDMYAMTAAHPTLPIPSYARVTNVSNGESVVVRVNDRGPFHPGRVMDLSFAAASRLGYVSKGHALVEVESIIPDQTASASTRSAAPVRPADSSAPARPPSPPAADARSAAPAARQVAAAGDPIAALARADTQKQPASPPAGGAENSGIFVQLAAFRSNDKAETFRDKVRREIDWLAERLLIDVSNGMYRLHIGPYASFADARAIAARIGEALLLKPLVIQR